MSERARRVALVLATSTGGVGAHVRSLAGELAAAGDRVAVLGPAETEQRFAFSAVGAGFAPVEIRSGMRPLADARAALRLRRLAARADVVHAHGLRAGFVAACALAGRRTPLVVTLHNMPPAAVPNLSGPRPSARRKQGAASVVELVERFVARRARLILGASADLAERARAFGATDVRFAPVAAPPVGAVSGGSAVRDELGVGRRPLVVAVGRLHRQKGFDVLVDAASRWRDLPSPPLVVIAGSGPEEHALTEQIGRRRAPVRLLGHRDDIGALLAAADVVVLSSRWEARALAAQEALRAGAPLVATAVGGIPDLVGTAALLVPADDVDALDAAVRRVLDDGQLRDRLAERGRARAAGWPDARDTARAVAAVYRQVVLP
jgi:glycosyltransferase involved in cell wall biosynthesis